MLRLIVSKKVLKLPKISRPKSKPALVIMVGLLVLAVLIGAALTKDNKTNEEPAPQVPVVITPKDSTNIVNAVEYVQSIYDSYLSQWDMGEREFINKNRGAFTEAFLKSSIDAENNAERKTFLFCVEPTEKPEKFEVTASGITAESQIASVYVSGYKGDKFAGTANMPVLLKPVDNTWKIDSVNCDLI